MKKVFRYQLKELAGKRKHGSQFTKEEGLGLWRRIKELNETKDVWRISGHALDRLKEKGIEATIEDIVSVIHNSIIIEYKIDKNVRFDTYDERVVLRAIPIVQGEYRLHAVYSLKNKQIVSVWLNHKTDGHETLDWSAYDAEMPILGL